MNDTLSILITWWKIVFTKLNILGIIHGLILTFFLNDNLLLTINIVLIPFSIVLIYSYKTNRAFIEISQVFELYVIHTLLFFNLPISIISRDLFRSIYFLLCFIGVYIGIPLISLAIREKPLYEPNRTVNTARYHSPFFTDQPGMFETCSICYEQLEDNVVKLNGCSHIFHNKCISEWLIRKIECPMCKSVPNNK